MVSVGRHKNITLLTYSEVENVSGVVGDFKVQVRKKARYVNEDLCTGCGTCVEKCPWKKIPDEFDLNLSNRPAIHFQYPQAVPKVPVIDTEHCAYFLNGKCKACEKFCPIHAIDFEQKDQILEFEVGTIILATGFKDFDPKISPRYRYGELENVITGFEFERLVNSGRPASSIVNITNGQRPKKIAIIHCVGSRGDQHEYCSRVCCMYSLKLAHLARDILSAEVVEFYRDMRTFGKDYEAFYERVREEGVEFLRYDEDLSITQNKDRLQVKIKDLYTGKPKSVTVDMVVLSTGMEPQDDHAKVAATFGVSRSPDGFFLEKHPKLAPVETATDGVYLAGACQGPKDIPDTVAQGGAAAAAALSLMDAGWVTLEPFTATIDPNICSGCQTCVDTCPFHAIETVTEGEQIFARVNEILCKGCGTCVAACPSGAASQHGFTTEQVMAEIEGALFKVLLQETTL
jgi:heterodisulfide reductase subunit A